MGKKLGQPKPKNSWPEPEVDDPAPEDGPGATISDEPIPEYAPVEERPQEAPRMSASERLILWCDSTVEERREMDFRQMLRARELIRPVVGSKWGWMR